MGHTHKNLVRYALLLFVLTASCSKKISPPPPLHSVNVIAAPSCLVPFYLDYVGHLEANYSVQVRAQVSGVIVAQHFIEGNDVKQGDLLLTIDPRPYQAAVANARAMLAQSEASFAFAQEKTARYAQLLEQNFVSQLDYDQYQTQVLTTKANVDQNKADLWHAQINLDYCFIKAPMDCTTGILKVQLGNYVDAAADTVLMTLNQIQPILVKFSIPEEDLLLIQKAQQLQPIRLEVFIDQNKTCSFPGTLTVIDNRVKASTGALLCQGTLDNTQRLLWPGHFVDVRAFLGEPQEKIVLPTNAVQVGPSGHYVYTVSDEQTLQLTPVTIEQRQGDTTIISEGVRKNDLVVISGQLNLYPGLKVTPSFEGQSQESP